MLVRVSFIQSLREGGATPHYLPPCSRPTPAPLPLFSRPSDSDTTEELAWLLYYITGGIKHCWIFSKHFCSGMWLYQITTHGKLFHDVFDNLKKVPFRKILIEYYEYPVCSYLNIFPIMFVLLILIRDTVYLGLPTEKVRPN